MPPIVQHLPLTWPRSSLSRAFQWSVQGLRLWRRAPLMLPLLCLVQLSAEALLQLIPWAGVAVSKLVVPLLAMEILLGLAALAQGQRLRLVCLLGCFRRELLVPALGLGLLWGFGVFGVQQLVACLVYGWPAVDAVLLGHIHAHPGLMTHDFTRVLILSGIPLSVVLMPAPFLFLFRGEGSWQALCDSVRLVLSHAAPFIWFGLINLALYVLMLATSWSFTLVLLIAPWSMAASFAMWQDLGRFVPDARPAGSRPGRFQPGRAG